MDEQLIRSFSAVTEEEQRLLAGGALRMEDYTCDASATIKGQRLLPRDRMITVRPHTRFASFPPHSHDYVEAMYMLRGQATHLLADGERVTLHAGELIFLNRQTTHAIEQCGADDVAVNLIVQPEFFDFALEMVGAENVLGRFLLDALRKGESSVPYLYFRIADVPAVQCLLQSMLYSFLSGEHRRVHRVEMGLLFLHLLSHSDRMRLSTSVQPSNQLAVTLLAELRTNYARFTLKGFAEKHRVSPSYVSRIARDATGVSCTELLQRRRLEKAKQLLRDTDWSVLAVSEAVGYSNNSYFYRLFEQRVGQSPSAYRASH